MLWFSNKTSDAPLAQYWCPQGDLHTCFILELDARAELSGRPSEFRGTVDVNVASNHQLGTRLPSQPLVTWLSSARNFTSDLRRISVLESTFGSGTCMYKYISQRLQLCISYTQARSSTRAKEVLFGYMTRGTNVAFLPCIYHLQSTVYPTFA